MPYLTPFLLCTGVTFYVSKYKVLSRDTHEWRKHLPLTCTNILIFFLPASCYSSFCKWIAIFLCRCFKNVMQCRRSQVLYSIKEITSTIFPHASSLLCYYSPYCWERNLYWFCGKNRLGGEGLVPIGYAFPIKYPYFWF